MAKTLNYLKEHRWGIETYDYTFALSRLVSGKHNELAMNLLIQLQQARDIAAADMPSVYNALLEAHIGAGSHKLALQCLSRMREERVTLDETSYEILTRCCADMQPPECNLAVSFLREAEASGLQLHNCYNNAMIACARAQDWPQLTQLLQEMKLKREKPAWATCDVIIAACISATPPRWPQARLMLKQVHARGWTLETHRYIAFIEACDQAPRDKSKLAAQVFDLMRAALRAKCGGSREQDYHAAILSCFQRNQPDAALQLWNELEWVRPESEIAVLMLARLQAAGRNSDIETVLDQLNDWKVRSKLSSASFFSTPAFKAWGDSMLVDLTPSWCSAPVLLEQSINRALQMITAKVGLSLTVDIDSDRKSYQWHKRQKGRPLPQRVLALDVSKDIRIRVHEFAFDRVPYGIRKRRVAAGAILKTAGIVCEADPDDQGALLVRASQLQAFKARQPKYHWWHWQYNDSEAECDPQAEQ